MQISFSSSVRQPRGKMVGFASMNLRTKIVNFLRYYPALLVLAFTTYAGTVFAAPASPILLYVDATDIARGLFHSELAIPVRPGPLTLVYPKWIPGYHAPVGPLNNIVRLKMSANGQPIEWKRDLVDMFAFHLVVPA